MLKLLVVIASTRPGRAGLPIGQWFLGHAEKHGKFAIELADLKEIGLPLLDEPKHPRFGDYQHDHTKAWSATVRAADAFVFVTPEYNYAAAPALLNAIDYIFHEWGYKPAGFVSYGGIAAGTRSVQMTKQILTAVKIMPIPEAVQIPFAAKLIDPDGTFRGSESLEQSVTTMLDELHRWAEALVPLRAPVAR